MSTIQVIKKCLPKPIKSQIESNSVRENKNSSDLHVPLKTPMSIEDIVGLSWVLSDD